MRIRRSFERDGTVRPRALNTLTALPQHVLNHAGHGKRHPVSVYGQSLRVIGEQWLRVFDRLDIVYSEYHWERGTSKYAELLHEYHGLLSRLHEHADACLSVLRSLCPVGEKPKKLDFQFLEQVKPAGWKSFRDSTRTYQKERLGAIVNTLKHDQGTLCMLYFYSALEFRPGYFLQDVLADGSLGPSGRVHDGNCTGFSFAHDMLLHLWWLYRTGDLLAEATVVCTAAQHNIKLEESPLKDSDDSLWGDVLRRCARIKPEFFPDEVRLPYPQVVFQDPPIAITLTFPTTARGHRVSNLRVTSGITVDGQHLTNRLPYFGEPARPYW